MNSALEIPALSVGAILGDSDADSMVWSRAIGSLALEFKALREGVSTPVRINIVCHVDGRMAPNEFTGVRTGRFDRKASRLVVQAAIPKTEVEDARSFLLQQIDDAIDVAESYVIKRGLAEGLPEIRRLVERVRAH